MSTAVNKAGVTYAHALVAAGKVSTDSWSFSAEDGNKLLGPNGDDWANYGQWFLATHPDQAEKTKGHYGYPFGKDGKVYRNAVVSAKGRAAQQGATDVEAAASSILDAIDAGKSVRSADVLQRAYSTLAIKNTNVDAGSGRLYFEGIATTPTPDHYGDIVVPEGAQFKLPMPFLYQHNSDQPIGQITDAKVRKDGIYVKGYVEHVDGPPTLRERLEVAAAEMRAGLVRGLSIGFKPLADGWKYLDPKDVFNSGIEFFKWAWLELSAVTIPANMEATFTNIKSIDQQRAALGQSAAWPVVTFDTPGASGKKPQPKGSKMKTIAEQLSALESTRQSKVDRMEEIMAKAAEDGVTLDAAQTEEYDGLEQEIKSIEGHVVRLKKHEEVMKQKAVPAAGASAEDGSASRQGASRIEMKGHNLPKGIGLARYVKALAYARGNNAEAQAYAKQWDDSTPDVTLALKAAVAAGTTADAAWAGPLVYNANLVSEFVEFLRPQTIIGKLTGFRRVPFNVRFPTQTGASTVGWVGEGAAKPVSKLQLSSQSLGFAKAAGIVVITQELARFSSPAAELLVRDDLAAQMIYFLDQQYIDPSVAAVANTNPASITNGAGNVVQASAVWSSQANVLADLKAFLQGFADNNIMLDNTAYWIMTPSAALALSMIVTANGVQAFPDITIDGGILFGIKVITSNSVPHSVSAGSIVAIVKASETFLADDGQVAIDVSQEASLQMDSAPTESSSAPTATSVVSMFQTNSIAVRAERIINWARRRSYGVGYIDNMHTS